MLEAAGATENGSPEERFDLTNVLEQVTEVARTLRDDAAACVYSRQALSIRRALARIEDGPPDWRAAYFRSLDRTCDCELALGRIAEARALAVEAWQHAESMTDGDQRLVAIEHRLGVLLRLLRCEIRIRDRSSLTRAAAVAEAHLQPLLEAFEDLTLDRSEHQLDSKTLSVCSDALDLLAEANESLGSHAVASAARQRALQTRAFADSLRREEEPA
jgi:hypothetical protein